MRFAFVAASAVGCALLAGLTGLAGWLPGGAAAALAGLCGLGLLGVVAWGSADPGLRLFGPAITAARTGRPEVALTFDDGPDPDSTPALLAALDRAGARATFFLLVDRAERHPELARAIAAGHQVGLHGLSHHPWLTLRAPSAGAAELREAARRLATVTGTEITLFRPPFGAVSPRLLAAIRGADLTLAWCSVRTRDGGRLRPEQVRARCQAAGPGDVVLLHEGRAPTTQALPAILADLEARGLRAVTLEALCASR